MELGAETRALEGGFQRLGLENLPFKEVHLKDLPK